MNAMDIAPLPAELAEVAARLAHTLDVLDACVASFNRAPLRSLLHAESWAGDAAPLPYVAGLATVEARMDPSEPSEQVLLNPHATLATLFKLFATRAASPRASGSNKKAPQPGSHSSGGAAGRAVGSSQPTGMPGGTAQWGSHRWANSTAAGAPMTDAQVSTRGGTQHWDPMTSSSLSSTSSAGTAAGGTEGERLLSSSRFSRMVREYDLLGKGFTTSWPVFLQAIGGGDVGAASTSHGGPWMTLDQFSRCLASVAWQQFPECQDASAALSTLLLQRVVPKLQMLAANVAEKLD